MKRLFCDLETYSPEPIAKTGLYKYALHPDFRILLLAYAVDDDPVQIVDLASGEDIPKVVWNGLLNNTVTKVAHNAAFERVCLSVHMWGLGILAEGVFLSAEDWYCTMVQASRCGLPMSLKEAGAALGLEQQKMTEGKALIRLFCTPKPRKAGGLFEDSDRNLPEDFPEEWATFKAYCVRDVEVERQIDGATRWLTIPDWEKALYAVDQKINDRGVRVDVDLAREACRIGAVVTARLTEEAMSRTGCPPSWASTWIPSRRRTCRRSGRLRRTPPSTASCRYAPSWASPPTPSTRRCSTACARTGTSGASCSSTAPAPDAGPDGSSSCRTSRRTTSPTSASPGGA